MKVVSGFRTFANESAFARPDSQDGKGETTLASFGLTKREYFAAMAMQGLLSNGLPGFYESPSKTAERAVSMADALVKSLNKS